MPTEYTLNPRWTEEDVRRWLLTWFSGGVSELPGLPSKIAKAVAVQTIFDAEQPEGREAIRRGLLSALQDWRARAHGYAALADLARAVALVRVSSAIGVLSSIIEREFEQDRDEAQSRALSAVVATLHGFAPVADVERALRRAFYHPRCDAHLAAQLFLGLARCRPEDYPIHTPRFLALRVHVPSGFMHIGPALLRAISVPVLIEGFSRLSIDEQKAFIDLLSMIKKSPLEITVSKHGLRLVWAEQPTWQVVARPHPQSPTATYADQFQRIRDAMPTGNINEFVRRMAGGPLH